MGRRHGYHFSPQECERIRRLCQVHSQATVAEIVGCSKMAVCNLKKRGWKPKGWNLRPMPHDLPLVASDHTKSELCKIYGCDWETLNRWLQGVERKYKPKVGGKAKPLPIPDDFEQVWREKGQTGTARHYGRAPSTIFKWQRAKGLFANRRKKPANDNGPGWVERYIERKRRSA